MVYDQYCVAIKILTLVPLQQLPLENVFWLKFSQAVSVFLVSVYFSSVHTHLETFCKENVVFTQ